MRSYQQTKVFYLVGDLTTKHIDRYFTCQRYPKGYWYFFVFMLLLIFVLGIPGFWWLVSVCAVILLLVCTIFILRAKTIPTHRQYDEWLEMTENYLDKYSRDRLRLEQGKIVPKGKCLRSFVLPDSDLSARYSVTQLVYREGKDHVLRFSFIVITFFYPTEGYIAVYTYRVNILNQYEVVPEKSKAYPYAHIVEFTISTSRASTRLNNHGYSYRVERVLLRAVHSNIEIGAYTGIESVGKNSELAPRMNISVDPIIDYLNGIVISKWR